MIIKTYLIPKNFDAITIYPFIFIKPNCVNNNSLINHELIHYKEQGILVIWWWINYLLSKKFRLAAEVRAYKSQLDFGGINLEQASYMLTKYKTGVTLNEAFELLRKKE